jgi:hypothetical protein
MERRARQTVQAPVMPAHQQLERGMIAIDDAARDRQIITRRRLRT